MKSNYRKLGNYIRQVDNRNTTNSLGESDLYGVSVNKEYIETHANLVGVSFENYKIVKPGQFTYIPDTSRRGDKIAIALNIFGKDIIVSNVYTTFEIINPNELDKDYLMLLFQNSEFDRYARYNSWGSAREVFSWEELCNTELNIPDIEEQKRIVKEYKTIGERIDVLKSECNSLLNLSQAHYKNLLTNVENIKSLSSNSLCSNAKTGISKFCGEKIYLATADVDCDEIVNEETKILYSNKPSRANVEPKKWSLYFAKMKNTKKYLFFTDKENEINKYILSTGFNCLEANDVSFYYLWCYLMNPKFEENKDLQCSGTTQEAINDTGIANLTIKIPEQNELLEFNKLIKPVYSCYHSVKLEIKELKKMRQIIISGVY